MSLRLTQDRKSVLFNSIRRAIDKTLPMPSYPEPEEEHLQLLDHTINAILEHANTLRPVFTAEVEPYIHQTNAKLVADTPEGVTIPLEDMLPFRHSVLNRNAFFSDGEPQKIYRKLKSIDNWPKRATTSAYEPEPVYITTDALLSLGFYECIATIEDDFRTKKAEYVEIDNKRKALLDSARQKLSAYTTLRKLLAEHPEFKPLIPERWFKEEQEEAALAKRRREEAKRRKLLEEELAKANAEQKTAPDSVEDELAVTILSSTLLGDD